jgi:hypothetical protein
MLHTKPELWPRKGAQLCDPSADGPKHAGDGQRHSPDVAANGLSQKTTHAVPFRWRHRERCALERRRTNMKTDDGPGEMLVHDAYALISNIGRDT